MSMEAEKGQIDDLMAPEPEESKEKSSNSAVNKKITLVKKKDFTKFGEQTAETLLKSSKSNFYHSFFESAIKKSYEGKKAKDLNDLIKALNLLKDSKEKAEKGGVQGKKVKKAKLAGGGGKGPDNTNAMMDDMLNEEDDYGDYGDEGEGGEGNYKEDERITHDFM